MSKLTNETIISQRNKKYIFHREYKFYEKILIHVPFIKKYFLIHPIGILKEDNNGCLCVLLYGEIQKVTISGIITL